MAKILKNTTVSDINLVTLGRTLPASSNTTIELSDYIRLADPATVTELTSNITSGNIVVNDGINDITTIAEALAFLRYPDYAPNIRFDNSTNSFVSRTVQKAIEEARSLTFTSLFGDGSDGDVTISIGTTVLSRTMYYNNLTLSSTGILNPNGYKIYVKNTLTISGTASIQRPPNNGTNGAGQTNGNGGAALTENDCGPGLAGQAGAVGGGSNSTGVPGNNAGTAEGYGNAGGASGSAGSSGTAGTAGVYTHVPERVVRHDHLYKLDYKNAGQGGAGGAGGAASLLNTGGGGGGGGSGGGAIIIFAYIINNTSSVGILARGGTGGNGGAAPSGNSRGGGGGGGGGGGQVFIVIGIATAIGTLSVTGGAGGTGGAGSGSGAAGGAGSAGSTGHTTVYNVTTNIWTVT